MHPELHAFSERIDENMDELLDVDAAVVSTNDSTAIAKLGKSKGKPQKAAAPISAIRSSSRTRKKPAALPEFEPPRRGRKRSGVDQSAAPQPSGKRPAKKRLTESDSVTEKKATKAAKTKSSKVPAAALRKTVGAEASSPTPLDSAMGSPSAPASFAGSPKRKVRVEPAGSPSSEIDTFIELTSSSSDGKALLEPIPPSLAAALLALSAQRSVRSVYSNPELSKPFQSQFGRRKTRTGYTNAEEKATAEGPKSASSPPASGMQTPAPLPASYDGAFSQSLTSRPFSLLSPSVTPTELASRTAQALGSVTAAATLANVRAAAAAAAGAMKVGASAAAGSTSAVGSLPESASTRLSSTVRSIPSPISVSFRARLPVTQGSQNGTQAVSAATQRTASSGSGIQEVETGTQNSSVDASMAAASAPSPPAQGADVGTSVHNDASRTNVSEADASSSTANAVESTSRTRTTNSRRKRLPEEVIQAREARKKERNRIAAQRSREKRSQLVDQLLAENEQLRQEVSALRLALGIRSGQLKVTKLSSADQSAGADRDDGSFVVQPTTSEPSPTASVAAGFEDIAIPPITPSVASEAAAAFRRSQLGVDNGEHGDDDDVDEEMEENVAA
ncbi:hypothetical protein DFJ73DRAFT_559641 [Zopfochytrium polystomum]|nr:hypothetical protein DFJ73DRAFT_559641 [Zopfochytrium polystomum]